MSSHWQMLLWTSRTHFWQLCRKTFTKSPKTIRSNSENGEQFDFLGKNYFSSKCFSGHVKYSFENIAKNSGQRSRTFCSKFENDKTLNFSRNKYFSANYSSGHVESSFYSPAENFSLEVRNRWKKIFFSGCLVKMFFYSKCSSGHVERSFDNSAENFFTKSPIVF